MSLEIAAVGVGEVIPVAGVGIVVLAVLVSPLWARTTALTKRTVALERTVAGHKERIAELEDQRVLAAQRERMMSGVIARGFEGTRNVVAFSSGVLDRLLRPVEDELSADPGSVMRELHEMALDVERAWAEAQTLTGNVTKQRSAVQQLAHHLGDLESATFLEERADNGELGSLHRAVLLDAASALRARATARSNGM